MELVPSYMYRIRTLHPPQRLQREHLLTYLGKGFADDELLFNARPVAGTQSFAKRYIVSIHPVRRGFGRENAAHYMNKIVRD